MKKIKDETGNRYGKLEVLSYVKIPNRLPAYWICRCDCGNKTTVCGSSLRSGRSKSCGCNVNQSQILKFKKENPNATENEILRERLNAHSKRNGNCIEWTATTSNGYGVFVYKGTTMNASRVAWIVNHGEIPKGLCVCHKCDNRKCVTVSHLMLGSHQTNTYDMIIKGRDNWETCRKFPIGTRERLWELRQSGKKYIEIAKELNMSMDQVKSMIQNHKNKLRRDSM